MLLYIKKMKVIITKSTRGAKKMMAIFYEGDKKIKTTHFGQQSASDYTIHHDEQRRQRYIDRHRKSEDWGNYMSAGSLSLYILWTEKTIEKAIANYKKKFNLT